MGKGEKPTSSTKYCQKWKGACTPRKYIGPSLQEIVVVFH
jgi:hypothetical protein